MKPALLVLVLALTAWANASDPIVRVPFVDPEMGFRLLIPHDWDYSVSPGEHPSVKFAPADVIARYLANMFYYPTPAAFIDLRASGREVSCLDEPNARRWEIDGQPACSTSEERFNEMADRLMTSREVRTVTPNGTGLRLDVYTCVDCTEMLDVFDAMVDSLSWLHR